MNISSRLAATIHCKADTTQDSQFFSILFHLCHLFLSSLNLSPCICRLWHSHFKCLWAVGVIPQSTSKKTWHAFRAQLPNASHYYHGSSAVIPLGKGPWSPHSISLPPWVMDLWYAPSPYGAIGHIYRNNSHTHRVSISLHCSYMLRTHWLSLFYSLYALVYTGSCRQFLQAHSM